MADKAIEYLNKELETFIEQLNEINFNINSNKIEIDTIDKKLLSFQRKHDYTADVFHSGSDYDSENISRDSLVINKNDLLEKNINLELHKKEVEDRISSIKDILENDKNVSHETSYFNCYNSITILEKERQRTSRDIHDSVVQNLTALIHKQEFISNIIDKDINRAKLEINNTKEILKGSINELRNIIYDLRPICLEDKDLISSLYFLCDKYKQDSNIQFDVSFTSNVEITDILSISVIRIIQELISNSVKHSDCSLITIRLTAKDSIVIIYSDNGKGFDFENAKYDPKENSGYGIEMLKERVYMHRGSISYNKEKCEFCINIPLINKEQ